MADLARGRVLGLTILLLPRIMITLTPIGEPMRDLVATVIVLAVLVPLALLGLVLLTLERVRRAILGREIYWSERDESPVR